MVTSKKTSKIVVSDYFFLKKHLNQSFMTISPFAQVQCIAMSFDFVTKIFQLFWVIKSFQIHELFHLFLNFFPGQKLIESFLNLLLTSLARGSSVLPDCLSGRLVQPSHSAHLAEVSSRMLINQRNYFSALVGQKCLNISGQLTDIHILT